MLLNSWSMATGHSMDSLLYDEAGYRLHPLHGMGWIITLSTLELKDSLSLFAAQLRKAMRGSWHQWEGVGVGEWAFLSLRRAGATLCCSEWAYHCGGFSCGVQAPRARASVVEALGLWSAGWVVVVHVLSCSVISGIYPDQISYWCPLHCKVDS